jgi:hypothetical protein
MKAITVDEAKPEREIYNLTLEDFFAKTRSDGAQQSCVV